MLGLVSADSLEQFDQLSRALKDNDPFIRSAAVTALAGPVFQSRVREMLKNDDAAVRLGGLLAMRRSGAADAAALIESALGDASPEVRLAAVLWAGEENVQGVAAALSRVLRGDVPPELFRAYTAAAERFEKSRDKTATPPPALTDVLIFPVTNAASAVKSSPAPRRPSRSAKPASDEQWRAALATPGDAAAGRQLFFDASVGCAQCHRIEDDGGQLGPDLSVIGRVANRDRIIDSILDPSKEIAPQFVQHTVTTKSGESYSGILVGQHANGTYTLLMNDGRGVVVPGSKVATHETSKVSLMPDELERGLTVEEFCDLLTFLLSLK